MIGENFAVRQLRFAIDFFESGRQCRDLLFGKDGHACLHVRADVTRAIEDFRQPFLLQFITDPGQCRRNAALITQVDVCSGFKVRFAVEADAPPFIPFMAGITVELQHLKIQLLFRAGSFLVG